MFLFKALQEKGGVKKNKTAPDMDKYVAKSDLLEVVSDLAQGVLGLKNLCAGRLACNTTFLEVQVESDLYQSILELNIFVQITQLAIPSFLMS